MLVCLFFCLQQSKYPAKGFNVGHLLNFSREALLKFIHERKEDKDETWDKLKDHEYDPDRKVAPPPEPPKEGYGDTIAVPEVGDVFCYGLSILTKITGHKGRYWIR